MMHRANSFLGLVAAGIALLAIKPAHAFWIFPTIEGHISITRQALPLVLSRERLGFTPSAIGAIWGANAALDHPSGPYAPWEHFDNELFKLSSEHIVTTRGATNLSAENGTVVGDLLAGRQQQAWRTLGGILHTLQDFYAHSTWVEINQSNLPAGHFAPLSPSTSVADFVERLSLSRTAGCLEDSITLDPNNGNHVVGAYYIRPAGGAAYVDLGQRPHRVSYLGRDPMVNRCLHIGVTTACSISAVYFVKCPLVGFEKDNPVGVTARYQTHTRARRVAEEATRIFVQDIVTELEALGTPEGMRGICLLMGQDTRLCGFSDGVEVLRVREICVYSIPSTFLSIGPDNSSNQHQHVCVTAGHESVPALFCRKGTTWTPKTHVYVPLPSSSDHGKYEISVQADGTFHGENSRVLRTTTETALSSSRTINDYDYIVDVNPSFPARATGSLLKIEENLLKAKTSPSPINSHHSLHLWEGFGESTQAINKMSISWEVVDRIPAGLPTPKYCYEGKPTNPPREVILP